jgi:hypothetical protein
MSDRQGFYLKLIISKTKRRKRWSNISEREKADSKTTMEQISLAD